MIPRQLQKEKKRKKAVKHTWPPLPQRMAHTCPCFSAVGLPVLISPHMFHAGIEDPRPNRRDILYRSVFDLVYSSVYLFLTDPRLLGWYLSLSPEDRAIIQVEGGLHYFLKKHPFLEMSRHHIYVKNSININQPSVRYVMHKSEMPGSQNSTCETHLTNVAAEKLPHHVMENLTLVDGSNNSVYGQQDSFHSAHSSPVTLRAEQQRAPQVSEPWWQMANSSSGAAVSNDPGSFANFSLEMEQERFKRQNPELTPVMQGQNAHVTSTGISSLKSEQSAVRKELPSECCNLDNIYVDGIESNNRGIFKTTKCGEETISNFNGDPDSFPSIMHDDKSVILFVAPNNPQPYIRSNSKEDASERETSTPSKTDQPLIQKTTAERFTSPMPCVPTCDVMVGTDLATGSSAFTQTQNPATADKHLITELHMSDLDYLAEEFIKLKSEKEELQKGKIKCSSCKSIKKCDYAQRAQQAELSLLALQYRLCRLHCLKVYKTMAKKDIDHHSPESPPANIVCVLKKLESDYNQMTEKIQAGIPLHDLKLLSVDCAQITGAYMPAQRTGDILEDSASGSSQQPQNNRSTAEPQCPHDENSKDFQDSYIYMNQLQEGISKMMGAVTLFPNERDTGHDTHQPNERQSATPLKDLNTTEAWYDAEEDLELAVPAETEQNPIMTSKHLIDEYGTGEKKLNSALCVSALPSDVSELPLTSSLKHRKVVSVPPMAEGVCLPQGHSITGSFDILMAELTQCHPDVGKQQILDALLELWVKHHGVLRGMTLRSIRQMTSDILTRPASTTQ